MGQVIWIEILSRRGDVVARHSIASATVRIGRGYDNDVVIDDPFVAPHHVTIWTDDEGRLVAEDAGSVNGLYRNHERVRRDSIVLDGGTPVRIGQTFLRARRDDHPVPAERRIRRESHAWVAIVLLVAAIVALELVTLWLHDVSDPRVARYAMGPLVVLLTGAGWAALWAMVCRVFNHQARFERNLVVALSGILAYSFYDEVMAVLAYSLSSPAIDHYAYMGAWVILGAVVAAHLRLAGVARRRVIAAVAVAVAVVAVVVQGLSRGEFGGNRAQQVRVILLPPALRLAPAEGEGAFFADAARLRAELEHDRSLPPQQPQGPTPFTD